MPSLIWATACFLLARCIFGKSSSEVCVDTNMKNAAEHRTHNRFQVQEGVFIVCKPHSNKLGQIMDISMGGLAFRYVAAEHESSEPFELDIFLTGHGCYMSKVPFKTISDLEMATEIPWSSVTIRRCGVQFGQLMPYQISQLEYLIREHTTGKGS